MDLLYVVIFFILGTTVGSFLNVVIFRINTKRSLGGRSACMSCGHKLSWYELVPVFSFIFLGGRCRKCKTKISIQYPLVELLTGMLFLILFLKFQNLFLRDSARFLVAYIFYVILFSNLLVISIYDLRHKIIPDRLVFFFGIMGFIGLFFSGFSLHTPTILEFLSGVFVAGPFAMFWLFSGGRWMGLGDAKLALGIGWLLGISMAFSGLVIAFWSGAIVGITLVILSKRRGTGRFRMKSEIPFAPFLVLGAFAAFIFELNLFGF